jgi:DNA-binding transcriptional ArsR family regulator
MDLQDPTASDALRVAVEPRRLQILQIVWDEERTVSEIAEKLPVSIAAVSQHLSKLRAAGLVRVRAEGRRRFYRATKADMGALAIVLESFWSERLDALAAMAKRLEQDT